MVTITNGQGSLINKSTFLDGVYVCGTVERYG